MRRNLVCLAVVAACQHHDPQLPPIGDTAVAVAAVCPTHLDLELIGSGSKFLPGWTGGAHGVGLATGSQFSVDITQCDSACRRCQFHGPVRGDPTVTPVISQRCIGDTSLPCTTNADCKMTSDGTVLVKPYNVCRFVLPPISSTVGPAASCSVAFFDPVALTDTSPVQGTIDLLTGDIDASQLNIKIDIGGIGVGCESCDGDATPFDAVQGGKCATSAKPCDIDGVGIVSTSYDCNVSPVLQLALPGNGTSTAQRVWTMDATHPLCTGGAKHCWCGMCTDGTPCSENTDCATGTCGTANGSGSGSGSAAPWTIHNNNCGAQACTWDPVAEHGTCAGSDTSCFPDTGSITATGVAEVHDGFYISQLANLLCMPPTGNGLIDPFAGFPGPLFFQARFRVTTRTGP